jgi:hypothetical protein
MKQAELTESAAISRLSMQIQSHYKQQKHADVALRKAL